ncbi:type III-A CRISPR-associated RAMP protein Csm4 [Desulfonema magnum]|uniref:CRISPR system Cms protein Csm4 n=1 Tax=Desulfonema magnum TaxID=45655 RepID=A0A975GSI3_9BACT|nr:type III-A CRISPR-associated RAMP protein Csm4 [Desulfonema magnum]QTA92069.1 CRISPR type III-A/MTUBE-associated RAMP protein [Desulfonema magnum]
MKNTYIVRLYFKNAIHIGASKPGIGIEGTEGKIIHSDTLWAALCNNWAVAEHALDIPFKEFLDSFINGNPLFRISSAFPMTNSGSRFWLPRPLSVPFDFSELNRKGKRNKIRYGKDIKKESLISLDHFKDWLLFDEKRNLVTKIVRGEKASNITDEIRPHNTLNRSSCESQIYHSGTTYFDAEGRTGMYFLLKTECENVKDTVEKVLNVIKETSGIGGNRGIGLGSIANIEVKDVREIQNLWDFIVNPLQLNNEEKDVHLAHCLLSLWHPNTIAPLYEGGKDDIANSLSYELILRKGWTGSLSVGRQVKRKTVHMFGEGSIFSDEPKGQLADLTPDEEMTPQWKGYHNIYRYGYAFAVPIKIHLNDYKIK